MTRLSKRKVYLDRCPSQAGSRPSVSIDFNVPVANLMFSSAPHC